MSGGLLERAYTSERLKPRDTSCETPAKVKLAQVESTPIADEYEPMFCPLITPGSNF